MSDLPPDKNTPAKLPCERCRAPAVGGFLASEALHSESREEWRGTPMATSQTCSLSSTACSIGPVVTSNDAVLGFCKLDPADESAEGDSFSDGLSLPWGPGARRTSPTVVLISGMFLWVGADLTHEMDKPLFTKAFSASVGILCYRLYFSVSQFSRSVVSDSLRPHESQHARPPCPPPTPGVYTWSCRG